MPWLKKRQECPRCGTIVQLNNTARKPYCGDRSLQSIVDKIQLVREHQSLARQDAEDVEGGSAGVGGGGDGASARTEGGEPTSASKRRRASDELQGGGERRSSAGSGTLGGSPDGSPLHGGGGGANVDSQGTPGSSPPGGLILEEDASPQDGRDEASPDAANGGGQQAKKKRRGSEQDRVAEKAARTQLRQHSRREGGAELGIVFRLLQKKAHDVTIVSADGTSAASPVMAQRSPRTLKLHRSHLRASERVTVFYLKQFLAQALLFLSG